MSETSLRIGTAGWAIPREHAEAFSAEGAGLARYAGRLGAAEINSSFYRPHRPATYARWSATVPDGFRFAVKIPKTVTHERRLIDAEEPLALFLGEVSALGPKVGPLLVQLPPSLAFDPDRVTSFLRILSDRAGTALGREPQIVLEPRHASWFAPEPDGLLAEHRVARVAADPPVVPMAAEPGGWPGLRYHRLHGSPVIYRSPYGPSVLEALASRIAGRRVETWCIFDNTASGAAAGDALTLARHLVGQRAAQRP